MNRLSDPMTRLSDFAAHEPQRQTPREKTLFYRELTAICRWSHKHAYAWILITALLCVPAFLAARKVGLDTDLRRLLPKHSAAVQQSEELEAVVGDGGFFSIVFEDAPVESLRSAVDAAALALAQIDGLAWVDYQYPTEFIDTYSYTLIPSRRLDEMVAVVQDWQAQVNPLFDDFDDDDPADSDDDAGLERLLYYYQDVPRYHETADGSLLGMLVVADHGISDLGEIRDIYSQMRAALDRVELDYGVEANVGGSLRTRVEEFAVIVADVNRIGAIAFIAILLTLAFSFRSLRILPVVIYPLGAALLWSFAFVPMTVGHLNTITSFLLMVLFGMGVDYSIHLVKRYRHELVSRDPESALVETFTSTGRSVMTSGLTTALGLMVLAISDFRGFADFGIIGGSSIAVATLAMLLVMPATLVVGTRLGLVTPRAPQLPRHLTLPPRWIAAILAILVVVSGAVAFTQLEFDYDFTNFSASSAELDDLKQKQEEIYPLFFGPGAIYVARDLTALDAALDVVHESRQQPSSVIGAISSIRDFAPTLAEAAERRRLIAELQEMLSGRWTRRIEDPDRLRLIDDVLAYVPTEDSPTVDNVPASVARRMTARDGSGEYVLALNPDGPPKDGRLTMQFTRELYDLNMPEGLRGPTGDKTVLAEILWLVTAEAPRILFLTFLGVLILVALDRRSFRQAIWVLLPLVASLLLTFGAMLALGWKLNFFNMVVLPSLLGLGVDHGIHYYRRWRELRCRTRETQLELFEPITVATLTTIMGYAGMAFAHHPGLRSIGSLAVLGLICTWLTALVMLPGLLRWREAIYVRAHRHEAIEPE